MHVRGAPPVVTVLSVGTTRLAPLRDEGRSSASGNCLTIAYSSNMAPASTSRSAHLPSTDGATKQGSGEARASEVLHDADGFVMATWKNITIHVWTVQATPALVDTLDRLTASYIGGHPEGISAVHIIAKNAPLPDADVRERLQQVTKRYATRVACVCHVVEGSGFWAGAHQAFLSGLHWLTRGSFRLHICSDIPAAARWLPGPHGQGTNVVIGIAELEEVLRSVRRLAD
jgi:hypothetical protein